MSCDRMNEGIPGDLYGIEVETGGQPHVVDV